MAHRTRPTIGVARHGGTVRGAAWLHFYRSKPADDLDIEWANDCADLVALIIESNNRHRDAVTKAVHRKLGRVLKSLRHEAVGRVPLILRNMIKQLEESDESVKLREPIRMAKGAKDLLQAALSFYTHLDEEMLAPEHDGCDAVSATEEALWLAELVRQGPPDVKLACEGTGPVRVRIGREALWCIVLNLVLNGKKYLHPDDRDDETVYVTVERNCTEVIITVDDGGMGMEPELTRFSGKRRIPE